MAIANLCMATLLGARWIEAGYFPLSNLYESLFFLAWGITTMHLFAESISRSALVGVVTAPVAMAITAFAALTLPGDMQASAPLVPALKSNWLMMHVSVMMLSYSTLMVGSVLAIAFLFVTRGQDIELRGSSLGNNGYRLTNSTNQKQDVAAAIEMAGAAAREPEVSSGIERDKTDGKPFEMKNDRDFYYEMRARFNQLTREGQSQTSEAALIFYYLNRTAFNGLCRFNNSGGFNVPFGRYKTIDYATDFSAYQIPLQPWEITCGDFETLKLEPDDFIYADPPYDVQFTKYSQDDFTWEDQIRLTKWLAKHPGKVVLSNQATDRIVNLYEDYGFTIDRVDAPRRISCNGDRRPAKEVIAYKGF